MKYYIIIVLFAIVLYYYVIQKSREEFTIMQKLNTIRDTVKSKVKKTITDIEDRIEESKKPQIPQTNYENFIFDVNTLAKFKKFDLKQRNVDTLVVVIDNSCETMRMKIHKNIEKLKSHPYISKLLFSNSLKIEEEKRNTMEGIAISNKLGLYTLPTLVFIYENVNKKMKEYTGDLLGHNTTENIVKFIKSCKNS